MCVRGGRGAVPEKVWEELGMAWTVGPEDKICRSNEGEPEDNAVEQ